LKDGVTLIAGNGVLPVIFARGAKKRGLRVCMISHIGETLPESESEAAEVTRVKVGQFGKIVDAIEKMGNLEVAFVGGITKTSILSGVFPDLLALRLIRKSRDMRDDTILTTAARHIESLGFKVVSCVKYCPELVVTKGIAGMNKPDESQTDDAYYGMKVLASLSDFSTGQAVVVKSGNVLAIEAVEGTDGMISRVGEMKLKNAVLVKAAKREQELRFDIPAVGPVTMRNCASAGISAVFLEAGRTMFLDRDATIKAANKADVAVVGI